MHLFQGWSKEMMDFFRQAKQAWVDVDNAAAAAAAEEATVQGEHSLKFN